MPIPEGVRREQKQYYMVKNKFKRTCIALLLLVASTVSAASGLTVIGLDNTEQQFALSQIGKITFDAGTMYLYDHDNNLLGYNSIDQVGKIVVEEDGQESLDEVNGNVQIIMQPAQQSIIVKGLSGTQTIRVFNMAGNVLLSVTSQAEQTLIDVSGLNNGTYLLQAGAQVIKFIKQ